MLCKATESIASEIGHVIRQTDADTPALNCLGSEGSNLYVCTDYMVQIIWHLSTVTKIPASVFAASSTRMSCQMNFVLLILSGVATLKPEATLHGKSFSSTVKTLF